MKLEERAEFERRRYCVFCGRRLIYAQVELTGLLVQRLSKRCPLRDSSTIEGRRHDLLDHEHEYPHRTRRGLLSRGSKRIRQEQLG